MKLPDLSHWPLPLYALAVYAEAWLFVGAGTLALLGVRALLLEVI